MTAANWAGGQYAWVPSVPMVGGIAVPSTTDVLMDADAEEVHHIGHVYWADRGSHTVSSAGGKIHWLPGASIAFVAVATLQIGIQDVDMANGPAARGDGSFDVSATLDGGTDTITTTTALATAMETGSKTMAHGALIAVVFKLAVTSGTQAVRVRELTTSSTPVFPSTTLVTAGPTYTIQSAVPNIVIEADDGTRGIFYGTMPFSVSPTALAFKNNDATKEYGNILRFATPVQVDGLFVCVVASASTANFSVVLYSDPLAAGVGPTADGTVSLDANTLGVVTGSARWVWLPLPSILTLAANTDYVVALKPDAAVNISIIYVDEQTGDMAALPLGADCYGVSRGTIGAGTAFASINSGTRRFFCGVSVCGGDDGAGGAGGGMMRPVGMQGNING